MEHKPQHVTDTTDVTETRTSESQKDDDNDDDPQQHVSITSYNTPHQSPTYDQDQDQDHDHSQNQSKPPSPSLPPGTYVIKLPVDQVHRVPPGQNEPQPDNATSSTSSDHDQDHEMEISSPNQPQQQQPAPPPGSYVIPLPIDQVYRVPPHREAAIAAAAAQAHQENADAAATSTSAGLITEDKITFCLTCLWIFFFLLFLLLCLFICLGLLILFLKPQNPKFNLQNFTFKKSPSLSTPLDYIAHMNATNPNGHIGFYYQQGSVAYVTCGGAEVARGRPPAFYHGKNNSTSFHFKLWAVRKLPMYVVKDMEDSDSKLEVPFVLYMNIVLKLKLWSLDIFRIRMYVTCSFQVVGSEKFTPENCTVEIDF